MNTQPSPLVPQGSLLDQKNQGRARVKIAVLVVLAVHGIGLMALLMAGCQKEPAATTGDADASASNAAPAFASNPPVADTNLTSSYVPPPPSNEVVPLPPIHPQSNAVAAVAGTEYTVVKNDSFYTIAKKLGVSQQALIQANPKVEPTKLQPGMKLVIPAVTNAGATTTPKPATTSGTDLYTVKSNDTLSRIATQFHTTAKAIQSANGLTTTRITVGQKLKIPVKAGGATSSTNVDSSAGQ